MLALLIEHTRGIRDEREMYGATIVMRGCSVCLQLEVTGIIEGVIKGERIFFICNK